MKRRSNSGSITFTKRMMHDAISERGGGDGAWLGIGDGEATVGMRSPRAIEQLAAQPEQIALQVIVEGRHVGARSLAARRVTIGAQQVLERTQLFVERRMDSRLTCAICSPTIMYELKIF